MMLLTLFCIDLLFYKMLELSLLLLNTSNCEKLYVVSFKVEEIYFDVLQPIFISYFYKCKLYYFLIFNSTNET